MYLRAPPVGHRLFPLHNVSCDWLPSIGGRLPADEGRVVVDLLDDGLFRGIGHLCDDKRTAVVAVMKHHRGDRTQYWGVVSVGTY